MFNPRFARHVARKYRRSGLSRPERRIVDWVVGQGVEGATVLEIGGGIGEIQFELLRRGASRTTNLELSPAYDPVALELAQEAGVADRVDRRLGDVAVDPTVAEPADFVVLHRVVCCYPDVDRLVAAAAAHARRGVILSHPPTTAMVRAALAGTNLGLRVQGAEYRTFAHSPEGMLRVLGQQGTRAQHLDSGPIWRLIGAVRDHAVL